MGKKVFISMLYLFFVSNVFGQEDEHTNIWNTFNSGKLYNQQGIRSLPTSFHDGLTSINNFNGNLTVAHSSQIILNNNLGGSLSLNYNANTGHKIASIYFFGTHSTVNAPCWILGFKGFALQTFNFENNFFIHKQGTGTISDNLTSLTTDYELAGEEVPLLITGYHFTNYEKKYIYNSTTSSSEDKNQRHCDLIYLLKADGSLITLYNPNEGPTIMKNPDVENTKVGTYLEYGNDKPGYAVVSWNPGAVWQSNGNYGLRTIDYKPGDGLTYRFIEEYPEYEIIDPSGNTFWSSWPLINRPRIAYLREILSSQGDKLILNYDYVAFGETMNKGRKYFKTLEYVDNLGTQRLLFENQYVKVANPGLGENNFKVHLSNNTTNEDFDLWLKAYGMDYNTSFNDASRSVDPNKTKIFNLVKISDQTTSANYTYTSSPIKRKYVFHKSWQEVDLQNHFHYHEKRFFILNYPVYLLIRKEYMKKHEVFTYWADYELNATQQLNDQYYTELGFTLLDDPPDSYGYVFHYNVDNMGCSGRDNYTTSMIAKVDLSHELSGISDLKELSSTSYQYSWDGSNYYDNTCKNNDQVLNDKFLGKFYPTASKHDNIKTTVTLTNKQDENDGPNVITTAYYYQIVNIYHNDMEKLDQLDKRIFLKQQETTNTFDIIKNTKYFVTDLGEHRSQGCNSGGYYGGTLRTTSEYDYFGYKYGGILKTYTYEFNEFRINFIDGNGVDDCITKKIMNHQEVRTDGFCIYTNNMITGNYRTDIKDYRFLNFIPSATQITDKNYNYQIFNLEREIVKNKSGEIISDVETNYYDNALTSKGKILRTINHNNTGTRQAEYTYEYNTTGQFKGYLSKKTKSDGSFEQYFYNADDDNYIDCKVVDKDTVSTLSALLFDNTFQMQPYKTTIHYNNTTQSLYTKYDGFGNLTYKIDENSYLSKYIYDNKGRLLQSYEPGSFPPNNSDPAFDSESGLLSISYNDNLWIPEITTKQNMDITQSSAKSVINKQTFSPSGFTVENEIKNSVGAFYSKEKVKYNYLGLKISSEDAIGRRVSYIYDGLSRPIKTIYGTGTDAPYSEIRYQFAFSTYTWDHFNMITYKDETGKQIREERDMYGNIVEKISDSPEIHATTYYDYDSRNRLSYITSPWGKKTNYGYDDFGNVSMRYKEAAGETDYKYDNWGNLRFKKHADAPIENPLLYFNTYDPLGRNVIQGAVKPMDYDFSTLDPDVSQSFENYTTDVNKFLVVNLYDNAVEGGVFSSAYGFTVPSDVQYQTVNTSWNIKTSVLPLTDVYN